MLISAMAQHRRSTPTAARYASGVTWRQFELDARRTTIADVLAALNAAFAMSYRSSIALDEEINGTYAGSLRRVISRVLDGYNYVIKQDDAKLDVIILGRRGERAVPVAMPVDPFHPLRERRRPRLLGTDRRHG